MLAPGTKVGPYEVVGALGAGGMGEVYRARDTRLKRDVALKVLPDSFAFDPDRMARLQREAETLAALNHPNIAQVHGLEEAAAGGPALRALVMELVAGEDLAAKIAHAPLPVDEAVAIARQIADALATAHDKGIVHRDLKPANIMVRADGTVKVLDFGLAKTAHDAALDLTSSPTAASAGRTGAGVILGTAAYMSPEQARGKLTDHRTDIWAFGCVLYEMLAGKAAFDGENVADTIAMVVKGEPDWNALPHDVPENVRLLLERCLEKDRHARVTDIAVAQFLLTETTSRSTDRSRLPAAAGVSHQPSSRKRVLIRAAAGLVVTVAALVVGAVTGWRYAATGAAAPPTTRFEVLPPAGVSLQPAPVASSAQLALSPDGRQLAFVAAAKGGSSQVWLRPLASTQSQTIAGTEGATFPFWSPDSRFIGFFAGGKLKKVDTRGGAPETLADAPAGRGGAWNQDGVILFAGRASSAILRVSASGGPVAPATTFEPDVFTQYWPQFLPDGRRFLYYQRSANPDLQGIYVASLDSATSTRVLQSETRAVYGSGHLFVVRGGILFAQPFDYDRLRVSGEQIRVADGVGYWATAFAYTAVTASASGVVAYGPSVVFTTSLRWHDRSGPTTGPMVEPRPYVTPRLSPDETSVIVAVTNATTAQPDLWLISLTRGAMSRVTSDQSSDWFPVWSPDGNNVFFGSARTGSTAIFQKSGAGPESVVAFGAVSGVATYPADVSSDGKSVLYTQSTNRGYDVGVLQLAGEQKATPVLAGPFNEVQGRFSPNNRWVAYASDESGRFEVYVRRFPADNTPPVAISISGGMQPEWSRDGRELFYLAADGRLTAVPVVSDTVTFTAGTPTMLFKADVPEPTAPYPNQYVVAADGRRFLVNTIVEQPTRPALTVILNWSATPGR
jgi:Tol biopolymer transport system component